MVKMKFSYGDRYLTLVMLVMSYSALIPQPSFKMSIMSCDEMRNKDKIVEY